MYCMKRASVEMTEYIKYYDTSFFLLFLIFFMLFFFYCLIVFHKFPSLSFIHGNIFFMILLLVSKTLSFILCLSICVGSFLAFSYAHDMIYSRNNSDDNLNYYYTFFFLNEKLYDVYNLWGAVYDYLRVFLYAIYKPKDG